MTGQTVLHYKILEPLGEGGMGVVYKALDTKLGRHVALKLLPPHATPDPAKRRRFLREARAASALNHPNIVTVYEVQTEGDTDVIVMEYVKGSTLLDVLRAGPISLENGVDYALQMAEGLAKAHDAGIIHRDLKPSNVMVNDDGLIKLMDFGLAKLTQPDTGSSDSAQHTFTETLTEVGLMMGTLGYMSPEQALGQPVDKRADIFSFGVLVYEMFSGTRPFGGQTAAAVLHDIAYRPHMPLRAVKSDVPLALELLLQRCLAKSPEERFHSMHEVVEVLRALKDSRRAPTIAGNTAIGLSPKATELLTGEWKRPHTRPSPKKRALWIGAAVLVLVAGGFGALKFLPYAGSGMKAATSAQDRPAQMRAWLDSFYRRGNIDKAIEAGEQWVVDEPNSAVARATLAEAYMRRNATKQDAFFVQRMLANSEQAIKLEPNLAMAQWAYGASLLADGKLAEAEPPLRRAVELDPMNPNHHIWLGNLEIRRKSLRNAEPHMRKAVEVQPASWDTQMNLGTLLLRLGRYEEARDHLERARSLAPDNYLVQLNLGAAYFSLDRLDQAATAFQRSLEAQPNSTVYNNLGTVYFYQGRIPDAVAVFERGVKEGAANYLLWGGLADAYRWSPEHKSKAAEAYATAINLARERLSKSPEDLGLRSSLATYLAKSGKNSEAREEALRVAQDVDPANSGVLFKLAVVHEVTGDRKGALDSLRRAILAGYSKYQVQNDPELLTLRGDPEYQRLRLLTPQPAPAK